MRAKQGFMPGFCIFFRHFDVAVSNSAPVTAGVGVIRASIRSKNAQRLKADSI
jgi:hypothetical protein